MRKSLFLTMAAALTAALSMTSCSNDVEELAPAAAKKQLTVTLTLPGNDAGTRATFEANMDGSTFNGLKSKWEADDEISVVMFNSDGSIYPDKVATFKQSGTLGNDGKTATFAGDALEAWGEIADGTYFSFAYPKLNTGDYYRDWSKQKGTLESLPKYDDLWFLTKYKDGKFELQDNGGWSPRSNFFLRFPKGMAIETEFNGNIILKFSCSDDIIVSKLPYEVYRPSDFIYATLDNPIEVGPVGVTDGTLSEDVYVALESLYAQGVTSLDIAITAENGSWSKKYQLNYEAGLEMAQIYTITNGSSNLTLKEYLKVGMVIGSDGKFYTSASEVPTGVKAEAMVAYLGNARVGGTGAATTTRGLAIALVDVGSWIGGEGIDEVDTWKAGHPVDGCEWRLPSADDVKYMVQGCGGDAYTTELKDGMEFNAGNFLTLLTSCGGTILNQDYLWYKTTTKTSSGSSIYHFGITPSGGSWWTDGVSEGWYVRACLAF